MAHGAPFRHAARSVGYRKSAGAQRGHVYRAPAGHRVHLDRQFAAPVAADMGTEDIELTWKLQRRFYDVRYEPKAIVWMTVPASLTALFKQRLRWARGLMQVLRKHRAVMAHWRFRRMWPMFVESVDRKSTRLNSTHSQI